MNKNEYKVNTYVLIKNGEIYEIDEEGCVKKAKNGENVPFYRKREISEALCKMTLFIWNKTEEQKKFSVP